MPLLVSVLVSPLLLAFRSSLDAAVGAASSECPSRDEHCFLSDSDMAPVQPRSPSDHERLSPISRVLLAGNRKATLWSLQRRHHVTARSSLAPQDDADAEVARVYAKLVAAQLGDVLASAMGGGTGGKAWSGGSPGKTGGKNLPPRAVAASGAQDTARATRTGAERAQRSLCRQSVGLARAK